MRTEQSGRKSIPQKEQLADSPGNRVGKDADRTIREEIHTPTKLHGKNKIEEDVRQNMSGNKTSTEIRSIILARRRAAFQIETETGTHNVTPWNKQFHGKADDEQCVHLSAAEPTETLVKIGPI